MPSMHIENHLKARMDAHPDVRWTNVARQAIVDKLRDLEPVPGQQEKLPVEASNAGWFGQVRTYMTNTDRRILWGVGFVGVLAIFAFWKYLVLGAVLGLAGYLIYKRRRG